MVIVQGQVTIEDIDEALSYLRLKIQDRYGNRLNVRQKQIYLDSINDLLDARLELKANENISSTNRDPIF